MASFPPKPVPKTPSSSPNTSPPDTPPADLRDEKRGETSRRVLKRTESGVVKRLEEDEESEDEREGPTEALRGGDEDMDLDDDPYAASPMRAPSKRVKVPSPPPPVPRAPRLTGVRGKVYELIGSRWHDRGTGLCAAEYDQSHDRAVIDVRDEETGAEILRSSIHPSDVYQKQAASNPQDAPSPAPGGPGSPSPSPSSSSSSGSSKVGTETLIVWTEPDGRDFSLSFEDAQGCKEMWDFICEVQNHLVNVVGDDADLASSHSEFSPPQGSMGGRGSPSLSSPSVPSSPERDRPPVDQASMNALQQMLHEILQEGRLPQPQMGNIREIETAFKMVTRTSSGKAKLCECVLTQNFWKACIEVHKQAEDLESLEDLHALCKLAQFLLLLNDPSTYDYIVGDEVFLGVMGMLEYDPEWPGQKANYREFLSTVSHFRLVVDFHNDLLVRKIHNVYRLQYIMDVVLARILDDPVFNVMKSCMLFQQVEIIQHITNDDALLRELFSLFADDDPSKPAAPTGPPPAVPAPPSTSTPTEPAAASLDDRRRDVLLLTNQLCSMGKMVQLPARLSLYRKLVDRGLLAALQWAFRTGTSPESNRPDVLTAAGEILIVVVDHDAQGVRAFILRQADYPPPGTPAPAPGAGKRRPTLIDTLQQLLASPGVDLALKSQITDASRLLLELPGQDMPLPPDQLQRGRDDVAMERFLTWFYDNCVKGFYAPILRLPEFHLASKDPPTLPVPPTLSKLQTPHILYLCELLATFVVQHTHRSSFFVLNSHISSRMAMLLLAKEKHIRIAAVKYFRALLRINNQFIHRHMISKELFFPLIELGAKEAKRDGLLASCYLEYFEHMRRENIKSVINHIMTSYGERIRTLAEDRTTMGRIFKDIILRWEQNTEVSSREAQSAVSSAVSMPPGRRWGQGRLPESEEEEYFNTSDDEDEPSPQSSRPENRGLKRKEPSSNGPSRPGAPTPPLRPVRLVDYDDNEDEDMDNWDVDKSGTDKEGQFEDAPASTSSTISNARPAFASGQDFGPVSVRSILRPRATTHTNGLGPSTLPLSPIAGPRISQQRTLPRAPVEDTERNGVRTPSPPPSKLRRSPPPSPRSVSSADSSPLSPPRLSEKRKRAADEDDDDVLVSLERTKRRSITPDVAAEMGGMTPKLSPVTSGGKEEKKIKLKLTRSAINVASPTVPPVPPPATAAKDNG